MATPPLSPEKLQEAVNLVAEHGTVAGAARAVGVATPTMSHRYQQAVNKGFRPSADKVVTPEQKVKMLEERNKVLEAQVTRAHREDELEAWVRDQLFQMKASDPTPPGWVHSPGQMAKSSPGTPILALGDWHWGEKVHPEQVDGLNEYDTSIAHRRAKRVIDTSVDLLLNHMVQPSYPGIVVPLLGDMISGDIHDELKETNELPTIPTILDLTGVLKQSFEYLADNFERVHVVAVVGNHGRNTAKMRAKNRTATSFDWLLYKMVELQLSGDDRITFQIPDGADARLKVYDHDYLITHGDQFRGGDGIIGPLGPLVRGDYKKRLRQSMVDDNYDTLITGHFHRLITLSQLITNGSLVGYNEYAYTCNLPFEPPQQAMWITHPKYGITFTLPVHAELIDKPQRTSEWVSVPSSGAKA